MQGKAAILRSMWCWAAAVALWLAAGSVQAAGTDEASALKDDAMAILRKGSSMNIEPKDYAVCVVKLERAMELLDKGNQLETALAQEVNSALYWARKFATVNHINEIRKEQGLAKRNPPKPSRQPPVGTTANPAPAEGMLPGMGEDMTKSKKVFQEGEQFARAHAGDDYAVALRWFQVADQTTGSDYSVKALALAREAQKRFAAGQAAKSTTPPPESDIKGDSPEGELLAKAEGLAAAGKYEEAFPVFRESLIKKETSTAYRKMAHAYFDRAQQMKEELNPRFESFNTEYMAARAQAMTTVRTRRGSYQKFNPNHPAIRAMQPRYTQLMADAKKALTYYDQAAKHFKKVLDMNRNKDLDAEGHHALCFAVRRGDTFVRTRGIKLLQAFLGKYTPQNDMERTLYEYCKTEMTSK